ncbi:MAG: fibronectin type III domain-containing protein [Armatimonadota bacterium]
MAGTVNVDGVVSLFRWMPDSPDSTTGQSVVIPLPDPSWGVNAASETGYFVGTASGSRSWRYRPGRGFEILPGLGLIDEAYAAGINSEGIACGSSRDVWGRTRAVVWLPQGRPVDLGLPEWIQISAATHVNDSQHIAGYFWGGGGQRPFVWDSFLGARPIEALVDTGRPYDIRQPTKITRSGLILAYAWSHSQPFEGWIILRPVPPPTTPVVVDEGKFTTSLNTLRANWESTEEYNGIAEYQYAISTSPSDPGSGYVVPWTSAGTQTGVTRTDLSLVPGTTYYWHVRAKSGNGKWSAVGSSDGITVLSEGEIVRSPGQAKLRPDGEWVMFEGVVTASFSASGLTYVQAPDRSSGIAVSAAETFPPGSVVQVAGSLATNADGERFVRDAVLTGKGSTAPLVPVCLTLRGCSGRAFFHSPTTGAGQRGVTEPPGRGLSTTGLLVRVTGRVNEIGPEFVLLNDGSFPFLTGVRVERASLPPGIQVGDAVSVTAISSLRRAGTAYQLLLRPRSSADWEKVQ